MRVECVQSEGDRCNEAVGECGSGEGECLICYGSVEIIYSTNTHTCTCTCIIHSHAHSYTYIYIYNIRIPLHL